MKVLKFSATYCQPCKQLSQVLTNLGKKVEEVDIETNPELAEQYGIRAVPVLIAIDDSGEEISRQIGLKTPAALTNWFDAIEE